MRMKAFLFAWLMTTPSIVIGEITSTEQTLNQENVDFDVDESIITESTKSTNNNITPLTDSRSTSNAINLPPCGDLRDSLNSFPIPELSSSNNKKNCAWAAKKVTIRCRFEFVRLHCPVTCGICSPSMRQFSSRKSLLNSSNSRALEERGEANTSQPTSSSSSSLSSAIVDPTLAPSTMTSSSTTNPTAALSTLLPTTSPTPGPSTIMPSLNPTPALSEIPTANPTPALSKTPSLNPTSFPSETPTNNPTSAPFTAPSLNPTSLPTEMPTHNPTSAPSTMPPTDSSSKGPLISFGGDLQNAPVIDYNLPDITPYTGRYLVSLPNLVEDSWWKVKPMAANDSSDESQSLWAWKPIGHFDGSVVGSSAQNLTLYEVQGLPTSNSSDYVALESIPLGELKKGYNIRITSEHYVTTAKIYMKIVGSDGSTNEFEFHQDLVSRGTSFTQVVSDEIDVGEITKIIIRKKAKQPEASFGFSAGKENFVRGIGDYQDLRDFGADDKIVWYEIPDRMTVTFWEHPAFKGSYDGTHVGPKSGLIQNPNVKGKVTSMKVGLTTTTDWDLLSVEVNGIEFFFDDTIFSFANQDKTVESKEKDHTDIPSLLKTLSVGKDEKVDLRRAFTETNFDSLTFYSKNLDSADFELEIDSFEIIESTSTILPTFGLMVRDSLEPTSNYFGLLFVGSIEEQFSIQTIVRSSSNLIVTGSQNVVLSDVKASSLKVTRNGIMYRGYYNNRLIGEAKMDFSTTGDETLGGNAIPRTQINQREVAVGFAYFSPQKYELGEFRAAMSSSLIRLKKLPIVTEQKTAAAADLISKKSFSIVEIINLSSFYGTYGAGRTIKSFSLLPGETSEISITSYKESTTTSKRASTIFDSFTDESAKDFENSVEEEQSNTLQYEKSREMHTNVQTSASGFGASVSTNSGFSATESSAREEMARSVMTAVSKHAAKASSQRDVEVNTSSEVQGIEGSENSVRRTIQNINSSRTLNFVFRQMNQQYISILHLVDMRVAFVGGGEGTYVEEDVSNLESFVKAYVKEEYAEKVMNRLYKKLQFVADHEDNMREVLTKKTVDTDNLSLSKEGGAAPPDRTNSTNTGRTPLSFPDDGENKTLSFYTFDKEVKSTLSSRPDIKSSIDVPGVILAYGTNVLRTDGIITDALLGQGEALDEYGKELQDVDIDERKAEVDLTNAKADLLALQKDILTEGTCSGGDISKEQQLEGLSRLNLLEPKYLVAHDGFVGPGNN